MTFLTACQHNDKPVELLVEYHALYTPRRSVWYPRTELTQVCPGVSEDVERGYNQIGTCGQHQYFVSH